MTGIYDYYYKLHYPGCCFRCKGVNYILQKWRKNPWTQIKPDLVFADKKTLLRHLDTINNTNSVCITENTPNELLNGGVIFITKFHDSFAQKFRPTDEIESLSFYNYFELMNEIKLGNIVEHDNFTPIKDTVHLLSSFPDNYKAAICKEKYKNVMSYPKGKRKINEDSTTCAMREFQEETGFVISPIIFSRDFQRDWRQFLKQETLPYEIKVFNTLFQIVIYE